MTQTYLQYRITDIGNKLMPAKGQWVGGGMEAGVSRFSRGKAFMYRMNKQQGPTV